ncbi:F17a-G fimbrial adhesin precursor [Neisseria weaveri]|nr:F17a-G fimbrial adhesin precursor [Neisseria weaveri]
MNIIFILQNACPNRGTSEKGIMMNKHFAVISACAATAWLPLSASANSTDNHALIFQPEIMRLSMPSQCDAQYRRINAAHEQTLCHVEKLITLDGKFDESIEIKARINDDKAMIPFNQGNNRIGIDVELNSAKLLSKEWVKIGELAPGVHNKVLNFKLDYKRFGDVGAGRYVLSDGHTPVVQIQIQNKIWDIVVDKVDSTIKVSTCRPNQSDFNGKTVQLKTISANDIRRPGKEFHGADFNLGIECDTGVEAVAALTDMNDQSNTGNILSIKNDPNSAQNVGIRLYRKGGNADPLSYGPVVADNVLNAEHKWFLSEAEKRSGLKFEAKYVNTGNPVIPGSVNATAMITLNYY